jgi:hypothetical protein
VSFRSEDVFVGDGGTGGAVAAALHTAVAAELAVKRARRSGAKREGVVLWG